MQTSAIAQTPATGGQRSSLPLPASGLSGLKSEDFFRILVSELKQQDPFEPAKTADMISQVSQIRSIELSGQLTKTLQHMLGGQRSSLPLQRVSGAAELIGKYVMATISTPDGSVATIEGVVTGVRFGADGVVVLELDTGQLLRADDVTCITTLEALDAVGTPDEPGGQRSSLPLPSAADDDGAKSDATARRRAQPQEPPAWLSLDTSL